MTKTLTEQWREGKLPDGNYYFKLKDGTILSGCQAITDGVFRCEYMDFHKRVKEVLAPVPSYEEYKELVSKTDELVQKIHILNEQNTKQYNELCEEIKKNNILEKQLAIATKALEDILNDGDDYWDKDKAQEALTKMEGVK